MALDRIVYLLNTQLTRHSLNKNLVCVFFSAQEYLHHLSTLMDQLSFSQTLYACVFLQQMVYWIPNIHFPSSDGREKY
jgi:hypothetical protein